MKVLVGIGCSHTAGTAFLKGLSKSKDGSWLELTKGWATEQLAKKYKDGAPTMKWVTYNLTWMAKLNEKLHYDKIVNLGVGGQGLDMNIINMKAYITKQEDLSGHVFIHQIPSMSRVNILNFWPNSDMSLKWKWTPIKQLLNLKGSSIIEFFDNYFNEDFYTLNNFYEVYYLQKQIEKLGGKYYCFSLDMQGPQNSYPQELKELDKFKNFEYIINSDSIYFEGELQARLPFKKIISDINWLDIEIKWDGSFQNKRLHDQGLVPGDMHFAEDGNEELSNLIFDGMK